MDAVIPALRLLDVVADSVPVPGFKGIVGVTLQIAETVQQVKSNKDACQQLANRAVQILYSIYDELKYERPMEPLQARIDILEGVLCEIEAYMGRRANERFLRRLFTKWTIEGDVQEFTTKLNEAVDAFKLRSLVDVSLVMGRIMQQLETHVNNSEYLGTEIVRKVDQLSSQTALYDGGYKLYGMDELVWERYLWTATVEGKHADNESDASSVHMLARLRLDQQRVVVKRFRSRSTQLVERRQLESVWHPNLAQVMGFSRPDAKVSFVVKQVSRLPNNAMSQFVRSLTGYRAIAYHLKVLKQVVSVSHYLADQGFEWTPGSIFYELSDLADSNGHVVIDPDWWQNKPHLALRLGGFGFVDLRHSHFTTNFEDDDSYDLDQDSLELSESSSPLQTLRSLQYLVRQWSQVALSAERCVSLTRSMRISPGVLFKIINRKTLQSAILGPHFDPEVVVGERLAAVDCRALVLPSQVEPTVVEVGGWRRYEVDVPETDFFKAGVSQTSMLHMSHRRDDYTLDVTHPWLLANAISTAAHYNVMLGDLRIAGGYSITVETGVICEGGDSVELHSRLPKTMYFFARSHFLRNESLDTWPWGYWSTDGLEFPAPDHSGTHSTGWWREDLFCIGYTRPTEVRWEQVVNGLKFFILVRGYTVYDSLYKNEVLLLEEVERWRKAYMADRSRERTV